MDLSVRKIVLTMIHPFRSAIAILSGVLLLITTGCAAEPAGTSHATTATPQPVITATSQCQQELIPPVIIEIQPAQPVPGSEIKVIGSGGYVRDSCGGYVEGSKVFQLYLDNEPLGDLSCYVNHCEAKVTLPSTASAGPHCLSTEIEQCQLEFQVTVQ